MECKAKETQEEAAAFRRGISGVSVRMGEELHKLEQLLYDTNDILKDFNNKNNSDEHVFENSELADIIIELNRHLKLCKNRWLLLNENHESVKRLLRAFPLKIDTETK